MKGAGIEDGRQRQSHGEVIVKKPFDEVREMIRAASMNEGDF